MPLTGSGVTSRKWWKKVSEIGLDHPGEWMLVYKGPPYKKANVAATGSSPYSREHIHPAENWQWKRVTEDGELRVYLRFRGPQGVL